MTNLKITLTTLTLAFSSGHLKKINLPLTSSILAQKSNQEAEESSRPIERRNLHNLYNKINYYTQNYLSLINKLVFLYFSAKMHFPLKKKKTHHMIIQSQATINCTMHGHPNCAAFVAKFLHGRFSGMDPHPQEIKLFTCVAQITVWCVLHKTAKSLSQNNQVINIRFCEFT